MKKREGGIQQAELKLYLLKLVASNREVGRFDRATAVRNTRWQCWAGHPTERTLTTTLSGEFLLGMTTAIRLERIIISRGTLDRYALTLGVNPSGQAEHYSTQKGA